MQSVIFTTLAKITHYENKMKQTKYLGVNYTTQIIHLAEIAAIYLDMQSIGNVLSLAERNYKFKTQKYTVVVLI